MWFAPHHDEFARVLPIAPGPSLLEPIARGDLPPDAVELRALWVDPEGEPLMLVASPAGPTLLTEDRALTLGPGGWSVQIAPVEGGRFLARISTGSEVWLVTEYTAPASPGGPFADDEVLDIFRWLAENANQDAFYRYWTQDWPAV
jgi:hypothetical protein